MYSYTDGGQQGVLILTSPQDDSQVLDSYFFCFLFFFPFVWCSVYYKKFVRLLLFIFFTPFFNEIPRDLVKTKRAYDFI